MSEVKEVIFTQSDTMQYGLEAMLAEDCVGQSEQLWEQFGQLHDGFRPGSCRKMLTDVSDILEKLDALVQALGTDGDGMQENYVTQGLSRFDKICGVVDVLDLDACLAEAWNKSKDARAELRVLKSLLAREASNHQLRRITSTRGEKHWQDVDDLARLLDEKPVPLTRMRRSSGTLLRRWWRSLSLSPTPMPHCLTSIM